MKKTRQIGSSRQNTPPIFTLKQIASLMLITSVSMAAWADDKPQTFNIPALPLDSALTELADKTNLRLLYQADLVAKLRSQPVSGQYSPEQALKILLGHSGLGFRKTADNAFTVEELPPAPHINQADPISLPKVTVVGNSIDDVKDPYNADYVLPSATSGTKTDTPIMETPLNVQVISKQVLKDQQVINLGDALKNVSGVTTGSFAFGFGNANAPTQQITIRGFASQTFFRNGFRLQQGSASREMANIESIEVLKGPAAILYGLAEPGGMVNVVTKQPLATPYYALNQQFGSYDLYRTTLDATGPLTIDDTLLYRMNMSYENSGSFRDLVFNDNVFLAPVLKWNISKKTQATLEMEYQHKNFDVDTGFIPIINGQLMNMPIKNNYGEYSPGIQDTIFVGMNWSHQFNDDWNIKHRVSANRVSSNIPIASYPSYQFNDPTAAAFFQRFTNNLSTNSVYRLDYFDQKTANDTYSTNLDITGHFDTVGLKHTLLMGSDYYRLNSTASNATDNATFINWLFNSGQPLSNINTYNPVHPGNNYPSSVDPTSWTKTRNITDQYGLYIQDQIKLPYNFHVMGGIRYQYIHQKSSTQDYLGALSFTPPQTQDAVTPRVGILWQPQNWLSAYANYVEGFGANTGFTWPNFQAVAPTSAAQYEGGIKTEFYDGRLRANFAYYDLTKTNVAANDPAHPFACYGSACQLTIGQINSHGPEVDIQGQILPNWNVIATYANTDIHVTKTDAQNSLYQGLYSVGTRYWGVPRNTASLFTTYEFMEDELKGFKIGGGVNLQDGQLVCCSQPNLSQIPGFTTVDLLAAYSVNVGKTKVTAQFNIKNLLDKYYILGGGIDPLGNGSSTGMFSTFGQPRFFMGSIGIQF
ncbi:TonB-dependent receptor [Methylomonas sp. AM2-LC]|uniref:TonB-dependent siderophore receptor n=1 Tax=Methylomonas sp. AM2-LC TaxID=3153301 RepID=UPI0032669442